VFGVQVLGSRFLEFRDADELRVGGRSGWMSVVGGDFDE
jgi:hypothetical protein